MQRLRERLAEAEAAAPAQIVLKIVDGNARTDLEFEKGRLTVGVDTEIDRENIAKADQPDEAAA